MSSPADVPTIPIRYLREMLERGRLRRAVVGRVLAEASLSPAILREPRFRVSPAQLERFHRALVRAGGDELFGYLERPVPPGAYATLLGLLTGADQVGSVLEAAARFYRLFDRHPYWRLSVEGPSAVIGIVPRDAGQSRSVFFLHSMLLATWRTLAWLAARPIPLDEVRLPARHRSLRVEAS